jgi:hypothetical protein
VRATFAPRLKFERAWGAGRHGPLTLTTPFAAQQEAVWARRAKISEHPGRGLTTARGRILASALGTAEKSCQKISLGQL